MTTIPVCLTHTADAVSMMDTPVVAGTATTLRCHDGNDAIGVTHAPVCVTQTTDPAFGAAWALNMASAA